MAFVWSPITTPFTEVLLPLAACSLAEPVWPCLMGTWWRFFLIGLFKREFMFSCPFSLNGMGMPRDPTTLFPEVMSLEADLCWFYCGLCLFFALSIVVFPGEPDRATECELMPVPLTTGETIIFDFLELERFSVMSVRPVMTRVAPSPPAILSMACCMA